jgi:hypothetical protein
VRTAVRHQRFTALGSSVLGAAALVAGHLVGDSPALERVGIGFILVAAYLNLRSRPRPARPRAAGELAEGSTS